MTLDRKTIERCAEIADQRAANSDVYIREAANDVQRAYSKGCKQDAEIIALAIRALLPEEKPADWMKEAAEAIVRKIYPLVNDSGVAFIAAIIAKHAPVASKPAPAVGDVVSLEALKKIGVEPDSIAARCIRRYLAAANLLASPAQDQR